MHEIKREILRIREQIRSLRPHQILHVEDKEISSAFSRLDEIAATEVQEEVLTGLEKDPEIKRAIPDIASFRRAFGLKLELQQVHILLKSTHPWKEIRNFLFYPNYEKLAQMEFYGSGLKKGDKVVFVGSGPLPMSLIMLSKLFHIHGIGIEREKEYAILSTRLINHLSLGKYIRIITGDHTLVPALKKTFSLYMVASAAYPKGEIFSVLGRYLPPGAKISYRTYEKGLRRLFCDFHIPLPPQLRELKRIHPTPPVNNSVVILQRV